MPKDEREIKVNKAKQKEDDKKDKDKPKRANGEGSISKQGNSWKGVVTAGRDENGKIIRKVFYDKNQRVLLQKMAEFKAEIAKIDYIKPDKLTVEKYLIDWLYSEKQGTVSDKYFDSMEYHVKDYLIPAFGKITLQKLDKSTIDSKCHQWIENGGVTGKKLSPKTVKHILTTLKQAMGYAVDTGKISKNPAAKCRIKKQEDVMNKPKYFTKEEEEQLIQRLDLSNSMDMAILTAIETGLRQGELIALTWGDIYPARNEISVTKSLSISKNRSSDEGNNYKRVVKSPKTRSSIRVVPISNSLNRDLLAFKSHLEEANFLTGKDDPVFPSTFGGHLHPSNISHRLNEITSEAGLPKLSFHKLRHTFTTRLIENGINIKVVQNVLGHSSSAITLDIYSHMTPDSFEKAKESLNQIFIREETLVGY